jgi:HEAT repeat protein
MGGRKAVDALVRALGDDDWTVRRSAAVALGKLKDPKAVRPLITLLSDGDIDVRTEAEASLMKIGKPAFGPLIEVLGSEDSGVRFSALKVLKKATGQDFGEDCEKWSRWHLRNVGK